jgi:hypothetical protein
MEFLWVMLFLLQETSEELCIDGFLSNQHQFKNSKKEKDWEGHYIFNLCFSWRTVCHFLCRLFCHLKMCCLGLSFLFIQLSLAEESNITSYHYYLAHCIMSFIVFWPNIIYIKINSTCCVIDMNMCCLIKFHVDMLTLSMI